MLNLNTHMCTFSQGGRAGDAYGITVSSLNKLKDTKSKVPRMSLLHYICEVCVCVCVCVCV